MNVSRVQQLHGIVYNSVLGDETDQASVETRLPRRTRTLPIARGDRTRLAVPITIVRSMG